MLPRAIETAYQEANIAGEECTLTPKQPKVLLSLLLCLRGSHKKAQRKAGRERLHAVASLINDSMVLNTQQKMAVYEADPESVVARELIKQSTTQYRHAEQTGVGRVQARNMCGGQAGLEDWGGLKRTQSERGELQGSFNLCCLWLLETVLLQAGFWWNVLKRTE
eukprot:1840517-Amphidinium_carterae.1